MICRKEPSINEVINESMKVGESERDDCRSPFRNKQNEDYLERAVGFSEEINNSSKY